MASTIKTAYVVDHPTEKIETIVKDGRTFLVLRDVSKSVISRVSKGMCDGTAFVVNGSLAYPYLCQVDPANIVGFALR